ncbi:autotransporter-associated beta strand repeat-containing protein, partial [Brucella sp. TWI432]
MAGNRGNAGAGMEIAGEGGQINFIPGSNINKFTITGGPINDTGQAGDGITLSGSNNFLNNGAVVSGGPAKLYDLNHSGVPADLTGLAGVGLRITGNHNTVITKNYIGGGLQEDGSKLRGYAAVITGNDNTLQWESNATGTSTIVGNVWSTGTGNVMVFAGDADYTLDFQLDDHLFNFSGFSGYRKQGASVWTINRQITNDTAPWFIDEGTLKLTGAIDISNLESVSVDGTLDLTGLTASQLSLKRLTSTKDGGEVSIADKPLTITNATVGDDFRGAIVGTAGVTLAKGTQIFSGDNTYSGVTTLAQGTRLQLGNGGATGSLVSDVNTGEDATHYGVLVFNRNNSMTMPGLIYGFGSVEQSGVGTTMLTGNNTYTGGTTITAGILELGDGGTSGSIVGDVNTGTDATHNGMLGFNRRDTISFDGVISGTGGVLQAGIGTTVLTAHNTYTGGTNLNAGILSVSSDSNLGDASGALRFDGGTLLVTADMTSARAVTLTSAGGTVSVGDTKTVTLTHFIGNAGLAKGAFTKAGNGTLITTASNSYTGGTTVSGGILQLGDGTTDGSIMGDIALDGGNLVVDNTGATPLSGAITGTGSVTQNGAGTLTLSGNNSYGDTFFNAGVISIEQAENLGSGALHFNSGTLRVTGTQSSSTDDTIDWGHNGGGFDIVDPTNTFTITSAFTGPGQLAKKGAGTLALTGDSSAFQGNTLVKDGTLRLDGGKLGDGTGTVDVASGAALGGHGSIGGNTTVEGTLFAQSGQVLTFSKDLTLNAGSNVDVTLNGGPSMSELFHVNGNLTIDGTLTV